MLLIKLSRRFSGLAVQAMLIGLLLNLAFSFAVRAETIAKASAPKIAMFLPLSGPVADWGQAMRLGAEMALAEGGAQAELIFEDTQFQPAIAIAAYRKVIDTNRPDAIIVFGSGVSTALAASAERDRLLMISIATSDEVQRGKRYVFRHMVSPTTVTDALVPEVNKRGLRRIASVATTQDGMLDLQRSFLQRMGPAVVFSADIPPSDRDFNALITKILALNADSVYSTLLPPQGAIFAKQARQLGFKGQLFAATQVNSKSEIAAGGEAFEGLFLTIDGDRSLEEFNERFAKRHGTPPDSFASNAYDALRLILLALASEDPIQTLETVRDYQGTLGRYSALPDHTFSIPATLSVILGGKIKALH